MAYVGGFLPEGRTAEPGPPPSGDYWKDTHICDHDSGTANSSGYNSHNAQKHDAALAAINELVGQHYQVVEHDGKYFALCPVCNGANQQGRIQGFGKELSKCTVIVRAGNFGGDVNVTASRKTSAIKRMLDNHLTSGLHKFCAGLATAHRQLKRSRYTALTTSEELVARLFRTALQVIDEYGSFLSFEKWVRLQDVNGTDMGNRGHSEFTMREMVICTAELWMGDLKDYLQTPHPITGRKPYVGTMVDKVTDISTKQFQLQVQSYVLLGQRKLDTDVVLESGQLRLGLLHLLQPPGQAGDVEVNFVHLLR